MIIGPVLVFGGLIALWMVLDLPDPTVLSGSWILWVLGAALVWILLLRVFPEKRCYVCGGKSELGWGPFLRTCPRCDGHGRIRRIGAKR